MTCRKCRERGQTWQGDPPKCSFEGGSFSGDGWSCHTAGDIRELFDQRGNDRPPGVHLQYCDDQWYGTINLTDIGIGAIALWVTWYKNRGRTDAMWLLDSYQKPRVPTEAECNLIVDFYNEMVDK